MKALFIHNPVIIFIAIGLIVVSTAVLSFVSYYYTVGLESQTETSIVQNNMRLAENYVRGIEKEIDDNDRILFDRVDVNEPDKWPAMVEAIQKADLNVDQVFFFRPDSSIPLYPRYSYAIRNQWGAIRDSLKAKELDLDHLIVDQPKHLHMERPSNYFFATFVLKETLDGSHVLVCYQMNYEKIVSLLDKHLRELQDKFYVRVVDFDRNPVYGQPLDRSSKYFLEKIFPNALYKWILQMVPANYSEIERTVRNKRRTNLFFVILSMCLIFISLAVISRGWRRDRQLRQLKENFISNVSHELKTPLSLIRMFSEILVMGKANSEDKKQEYYRIINSESDRMSRLINNLLDFASLIRGIEYKHFEKTNIAQLVTKALEAYRYEVQKEGFQLNLMVDPGIPDSFADPNAITMALFNLLDNSVKYSGENKQIDIRVDRTDGFVDLSVVDKGLGIPISEQQKIFDKFYRGSDPMIRRVRGSGIGLAITKHVAEMHGGQVLVESEPGKGSTFTLRIPIRDIPRGLNKQESEVGSQKSEC
jgi:two-component system phosphate regulon sensor histidine kinase PhoR